jgi:glutathione S-transferase
MLTLYHSPQSRSSRFIWMLEELGQPYDIEYVTIRRGDGSGGSDPKNRNPRGKVPALEHDGRLVTESGAITLYLTDAFPEAGLAPRLGDADRGDYLGWLFFYVAEVEPGMILKALEVTNPMMANIYDPMVAHFEGRLMQSPYIAGDKFTALDVLFASAVQWGGTMLPKSEVLDAYLARLIERPAYTRAQAKEQP